MTNRDTTKIGTVQTNLSIAIELIDHVTDDSPIGNPAVRLASRPERFTRTTDSYYVVADLPESVENLTVSVDGSPTYLPAQITVDLTDPNRAIPEPITLLPAPGYPLGRRETAVRGAVIDETETPVPKALITIQDRDERTRSTSQGEFLLPIIDIASDDVAAGALQVDGDTPTLEATHPTTNVVTTQPTPISIGETVRQDIQF